MTSETLFLNLMKANHRYHRWFGLVIFITFIFVNPVLTLMKLDGFLLNDLLSVTEVHEKLFNQVNFSYWGNIGITITIAVIIAIREFSYLYSQKKVDLFHSFPVKREKLFLSSYLVGFSYYLISCITSCILNAIALYIKGFLSVKMWGVLGETLLFNILCFLIFYHLTIIAIMLTGHMRIGFCLTILFIFYVPLVIELIRGYYEQYMSSFFRMSHLIEEPSIILATISPLITVSAFMYHNSVLWSFVVIAVVMIIITFISALYLYQKRPSECAGKSLCFSHTEHILRFLLVLPISLTGGLYIKSSLSNLPIGWYWFAFISAGLVTHSLLSIMLHFDFKTILNHKLQFILIMGLSATIAFAFQFDWCSFDSYIPKEDDVEYASVFFTNIDPDVSLYNITKNESDNSYSFEYSNSTVSVLNNLKLYDIEDVINLSKIGIAQTKDIEKRKQQYQYGHIIPDGEIPVVEYMIKYHLKSGKNIYRSYFARITDAKEAIAKIYDQPAYKEATFQLDDLLNTGYISQIELYNIWEDRIFTIDSELLPAFRDAYLADLNHLTIETLSTQTPIIRLESVCDNKPSDRCTIDLCGYYIYPSYTNTLNFLQENGVARYRYNDKINPHRIVSIEITPFTVTKDYYSEGTFITYLSQNRKDRPMIKDISKHLMVGFSTTNYVFVPYENNVNINIEYIKDNGIKTKMNAFIPLGQMPKFLKKDIQNNGRK